MDLSALLLRLLSFSPRNWFLSVVSFGMGLLAFIALLFWLPPWNFPRESIVRVERGSSVSATAQVLTGQGLIRSPFWFKVAVVLTGGHGSIVAGDYYFEKPQGLFSIANRVISADYRLTPLRVTIPEGLSIFQTADILSSRLPFFDPQLFVETAPEGYVFPDTYFFLPNATAEEVIAIMSENFEKKTQELKEQALEQGKDWEDIVTMASIVEEEVKHDEDRAIVSGILWNRIEIGMALQVDATFSYVNGKNSYTLSHEDLLEDSPYNTYQNTGLPPTPIAGPGLKSIEAALYPAETEYLYFLSDLAGNMYYAEGFEGHQRNRELYLRR